MRVLFPLDGSERGFASMEAALDLLKGTTVQAASEGLGKGSTFTVRIPLDLAHGE